MSELIGAGAILEAGDRATATPAAFHALVQTETSPAVAAIDMDGRTLQTLRRLLLVVEGWDAARFDREVLASLKARGEVSLAEVLIAAASAAGSNTIDLFAPWAPDDVTAAALSNSGIALRSHSPGDIVRAALTAGQRCRRWGSMTAA